MDLDRKIGNRNGELEWGGFNFSKSSEDIKLVDGTTIVAKARRWDGTMEHSSISLNDCIRNENGCLIIAPDITPP
ncbi:hypothetical protein BGX20_001277 [Mortierella sp. AD010]|nr:hypothetical protein BGX20_001277 [Mortierella sp. AD010]